MNRLKLIAFDNQDLDVIAAHVQDAVLKVGGMKYNQKEQRFFMQLNRFVWEKSGDASGKTFERRIAVLHFERVTRVQLQQLNQKEPETVLDLLTIRYNQSDDADPSGFIELIFAGGATMSLWVECIEAQLTDMNASWQTNSLPSHDGDMS